MQYTNNLTSCLVYLIPAASYRGPGEDEDKDSYAARIAFTGNSRILGPICIAVGLLMLCLGGLLCALTRRARRRERRVGFHCPLHGDFYPLSPAQGAKLLGKFELKTFCSMLYIYIEGKVCVNVINRIEL